MFEKLRLRPVIHAAFVDRGDEVVARNKVLEGVCAVERPRACKSDEVVMRGQPRRPINRKQDDGRIPNYAALCVDDSTGEYRAAARRLRFSPGRLRCRGYCGREHPTIARLMRINDWTPALIFQSRQGPRDFCPA